jgi:hypothetical protein
MPAFAGMTKEYFSFDLELESDFLAKAVQEAMC